MQNADDNVQNAGDNVGESGLHWAAREGDVEVLALMVEVTLKTQVCLHLWTQCARFRTRPFSDAVRPFSDALVAVLLFTAAMLPFMLRVLPLLVTVLTFLAADAGEEGGGGGESAE